MTAGLKARTGTPGRRAPLDTRLAKALLAAVGSPPIGIALWSGESFAMQDTVAATLRIRDRATLLKLLLDPERNFGDAYTDGSVEIEGDLVQLMEAGFRARQRARLPAAAGRRLPRFLDRPRINTLANSRQNIHHHYDLGNAFYRLWLDRELAYTCAYFPTPEATLEQAQAAKMDLVCRKLRLRAGETVVEAGCGWGAFALHAALRHGASVRAFNLSREQLAFLLREIGILPIWICPVRAPDPARVFPLYRLAAQTLFVNFGFWGAIAGRSRTPPGWHNRAVELKVGELGGIKSLYSESYFPETEFWQAYGGGAYRALKARYDPHGAFGDLYRKCVLLPSSTVTAPAER